MALHMCSYVLCVLSLSIVDKSIIPPYEEEEMVFFSSYKNHKCEWIGKSLLESPNKSQMFSVKGEASLYKL